jgi:hypothetical protein
MMKLLFNYSVAWEAGSVPGTQGDWHHSTAVYTDDRLPRGKWLAFRGAGAPSEPGFN